MASAAVFSYAITRNADTIHAISRKWAAFLLWLTGVRVQMEGLDHIPGNLPVLVISNHQSMMDILVLSAYLPIRFAWIAKRELFRIPLLGSAMKAAGYISIDRENREKAYRSLEIAAEQIRRMSIVIFPEGTRTRTGKLGPFKQGAIHLTEHSRVPILPITITNSFERIPPEKKGIVPGTIHVAIDPIVPTQNLNRAGILAVMDEIRLRMEDRIAASMGDCSQD